MSFVRILIITTLFFAGPFGRPAPAQPVAVNTMRQALSDFQLAGSARVPTIVVGATDFPGVLRAATDLQLDIERVTGRQLRLEQALLPGRDAVIIGAIGKSHFIDQLIGSGKLNVTGVAGQWEAFVIQTIDNPAPGIAQALVIAGSDKRGAIYGIYEVSKQIGVSPWYWWADVPPRKSGELYIPAGRYVHRSPAVKYRGIFINDEEPALGRWAVANYGGFTSGFYKRVFELMLRLKANYLWPAMWWASFNENDTLNARLADEYGVVMGTTHHEPMNRAHADWRKHGNGPWNYETNGAVLKKFWNEGIERIGNFETIVSLGMRGDGDMAMSDETNIALLERIVADQRNIIADVTRRKVTQTPQLWALYKEVQDYYDQGMRVPDDVTLLLCDDNWGNLRKLPHPADKPRPGGYGIYYHFDYVGGPRNYKWLNTNPLPRIWEQMHLAYRYGANQIWIVNVGDIKHMELPTEFFLDYAWSPDAWPHDRLNEYTQQWAARQFGTNHAAAIAEILSGYTKFNARRKPELLSADIYSLHHYREAERVTAEFNALAASAEKIYTEIPEVQKDAFYQLVLHPAKACANLNELWVTVAKNRLFAAQGRASANQLAERAKMLFDRDSAFSHHYNHVMAGGKWNHLMNQTHISYTYWQQPPKDILPEVKRIDLPAGAHLGVAAEGYEGVTRPGVTDELELPEFDNYTQQTFFIDVFNRGKDSFRYTAAAKSRAIKISPATGFVEKEQRIFISVDWKALKPGIHRFPIVIKGAGTSVTVWATARVASPSTRPVGFVQGNGYVSINAENFSRSVPAGDTAWRVLPDHGRTSSAITVFPVTAPALESGPAPYVEYDFHLTTDSEVVVYAYFSPTLNFHGKSLRCAIAMNDEAPQVLMLHENMNNARWEQWVADNILIKKSVHGNQKAGNHTLKIQMVDPGVVLQKIVIDAGGLKPSYLGPPESKRF
jgi:hypothetical protein